MTTRFSRKGSALLVVLGMVAFMVISAVSFSAYMRYARLPSSYLRRTSSTRLLAKAAVAEAIEVIDRAINNNPHPGVGDQSSSLSGGSNLNYWVDRVFVGDREGASYIDELETYSPLCVEALAYMPPALVNRARYHSRQVPTGYWQTFSFDAGRFVWCALDVSDYFDVNRMVAGEHRTSADARRITLSHIFEDDEHTSAATGADKWDSRLKDVRGELNPKTFMFDSIGDRYPLISLADFNLWLGHGGAIGNLKSPFYGYYGDRDGTFVDPGFSHEVDVQRMTFVTDSKFVQPARGKKNSRGEFIFDINDPQCQPFTSASLEDPDLDLWMLINKGSYPSKAGAAHGSEGMDIVQKLSVLGCAALHDYLDPDHYPISLAIPTAERVPMICGIDSVFPGSRFRLNKEYQFMNAQKTEPHENGSGGDGVPSADQVGTTRKVRQVVRYRIGRELATGFAGAVRALVCFPFAHEDGSDSSNFKLDGRLSLFLTSGDSATLRASNPGCVYKLPHGELAETTWDERKGLINAKLQNQSVSFSGRSPRTEEEAFKTVEFALSDSEAAIEDLLEREEFIRVEYQWEQVARKIPGGGGGGINTGGGTEWYPKWNDALAGKRYELTDNCFCGLPPSVWKNGTCNDIDPDFTSGTRFKTLLQDGGKDLQLRAALWLRVKDGSRVVDMVPAAGGEDFTQNEIPPTYGEDLAADYLGAEVPLMLFDTLATFTCSLDPEKGLDKLVGDGSDVSLSPRAMFCPDPRYNHAPEDWYRTSSDLTPTEWLKDIRSNAMNNGRDTDIFMATSDSGYLQSRYEIAHIPCLTDIANYAGDVAGGYSRPDVQSWKGIPDAYAKTAHTKLFWLTYDPQDITEFLPWLNEGPGFKVNPYSDSTNVLMAAFANTPLDWKRAATNEPYGSAPDYAGMAMTKFNSEWAWNEYSSSSKMEWKDLESIAGNFSHAARTAKNWEEAWDDISWNFYPKAGTDDPQFAGVELGGESDIPWCHDRKFLYGYWRDSFAARQQLFLVFVRAEPTMMGGEGQTPPQLGARAMALVWRDPEATEGDEPHQTRILFYRQFE